MPQLFGFDKVAIRGPKPAPVIGTMASLYRLLDDPVGVVMGLRGQGEVVALIDQSPAVICVFGAERNREILTQPATFLHDETMLQGTPGSAMNKIRFAMVTINGDMHRRHRKLMQPAFQKSALDDYAADIVAATRVMLEGWKVGEVNRVDDLCREVALAIAMKCFYGLDIGEEAHELGHLAVKWVNTITDPKTILLPFDLPGLGYRKMLKYADVVVSRLQALIDRKRSMGGEQKDAMSLLMNAREDDLEPLSDDELIAEAATLFIAGHDTIAMTLVWTLLLLERHPAVHAALMAELDAVLGGRDPAPDDLPKMAVLDRVIKESMRILPSVPLLVMRVCADAAMVGGFSVPKNSNVLVSPLATHHDPDIYPEPQRFRPERWLSITPSAYEYLPFSVGARNCIGMLFAERALRLILPMILQRFRFSIPAGTRIDRLTRANILHPRHSLPMHIEPASAPARPPAPIEGDIHELVVYSISDKES